MTRVAPKTFADSKARANLPSKLAAIEMSQLVPMTPADLQNMAMGLTGKALSILNHVMCDDTAPASARVTAALAILERGAGKVAQQVKSETVDMTQLHLAAMKEHMARRQARDITPQVTDIVEGST